METVWIETYSRQINAINRSLEEAGLRNSADGIVNIKATGEIFRGAIAELKRLIGVNKELQIQLDEANAKLSKIKEV